MVVPIVARKRKEKQQKSFMARAWPFLLGSCFIAAVVTAIAVTIITGIKVFNYFN